MEWFNYSGDEDKLIFTFSRKVPIAEQELWEFAFKEEIYTKSIDELTDSEKEVVIARVRYLLRLPFVKERIPYDEGLTFKDLEEDGVV